MCRSEGYVIQWRVKPGGPTYQFLPANDLKWTSYFTDKRTRRPVVFSAMDARWMISALRGDMAFVKPEGLPKFERFQFRLKAA